MSVPADRWVPIARQAVRGLRAGIWADDCVGAAVEAFARLDAEGRLPGDESHLAQLARSRAIDELRRRNPGSRTAGGPVVHAPIDAMIGELRSLPLPERVADIVRDLAGHANESDRAVRAVLLVSAGYSHAEAGRIMGVSESRVSQLVTRSAQRMRRRSS